MPSAELEKLMGQSANAISKIVEEAYAAGVEAGKREAARYISGMAATMLDPSYVPQPSLLSKIPYSTSAPEKGVPMPPQTRAPRGSVRPAVVRYIRSGRYGTPC